MKTFNMDSGGRGIRDMIRTTVGAAKERSGSEQEFMQGDYTSTLDSNLMCYRQVNSRQISIPSGILPIHFVMWELFLIFVVC